jgi:TadE-like protein
MDFALSRFSEQQSPVRGLKRRRSLRGQSLLELAFSFVVLVMLMSGIVDLGRAFFVKMAMDSMLGEGGQWAAAFPGCIPTANNATDAPQVPPECKGSNSIVGRMINESPDLDRARMVSMSVTPVNAQPVDVILLKLTYELPTLTPVIQVLFGKSLTLTAEIREVVRGSGKPPYNGAAMADQGGIPPVYPVTGVIGECNNGVVGLAWDVMSSGTGYHVWKSDATYPETSQPAPVELVGAGTAGGRRTWTDPVAGASGDRYYVITSYNQVGDNHTDSAPVRFAAHCGVAAGP